MELRVSRSRAKCGVCGSKLPPRTEAWFDDDRDTITCISCERLNRPAPLAGREIRGESLAAPAASPRLQRPAMPPTADSAAPPARTTPKRPRIRSTARQRPAAPDEATATPEAPPAAPVAPAAEASEVEPAQPRPEQPRPAQSELEQSELEQPQLTSPEPPSAETVAAVAVGAEPAADEKPFHVVEPETVTDSATGPQASEPMADEPSPPQEPSPADPVAVSSPAADEPPPAVLSAMPSPAGQHSAADAEPVDHPEPVDDSGTQPPQPDPEAAPDAPEADRPDGVGRPGPLVAELPFADGAEPLSWKGDLFQGPPVPVAPRVEVEQVAVSVRFDTVVENLARGRVEPADPIGLALSAAEERGLIWMTRRRTPGGFEIDHLTVTPNGIWVMAAEPAPTGRVEKRDIGDWFTPEPRLYVGDDDHTHTIRRIEAVDDSLGRALRGTIAAEVPRYKVVSFIDSPPGWLDRPFPFEEVWVTWSHHLVEPMLSTVTYQRDEVADLAEIVDKVLGPSR